MRHGNAEWRLARSLPALTLLLAAGVALAGDVVDDTLAYLQQHYAHVIPDAAAEDVSLSIGLLRNRASDERILGVLRQGRGSLRLVALGIALERDSISQLEPLLPDLLSDDTPVAGDCPSGCLQATVADWTYFLYYSRMSPRLQRTVVSQLLDSPAMEASRADFYARPERVRRYRSEVEERLGRDPGAAGALAQLGDPGLVETLQELLRSDPVAGLEAAARQGSPALAEAIAETGAALRNGFSCARDRGCRAPAWLSPYLEAVASLPVDLATPMIRELLDPSSAGLEQRVLAAGTLEFLGQMDSVPERWLGWSGEAMARLNVSHCRVFTRLIEHDPTAAALLARQVLDELAYGHRRLPTDLMPLADAQSDLDALIRFAAARSMDPLEEWLELGIEFGSADSARVWARHVAELGPEAAVPTVLNRLERRPDETTWLTLATSLARFPSARQSYESLAFDAGWSGRYPWETLRERSYDALPCRWSSESP